MRTVYTLVFTMCLRVCGCEGTFSSQNLQEVKPRMPNAKVLSEKQAAVAALAEKMKNASAGVFVDYKGITV